MDTIKRLPVWPLISMASAVLAGCGSAAPPDQAGAEPPPVQASPPPPDVASDGVAATVRAAFAYDPGDARYFDTRVDLDGDGVDEVVAYVAGPDVCGTGGCPLLVLRAAGEGFLPVATITVAQTPVWAGQGRSRGWRNLLVSVAGGGASPTVAELQFDGATYPGNPTVPPARPGAATDGADLLIPAFGSYRDGKPLGAPEPEGASVYGDPALRLAGRVGPLAIHTTDAEELRYVVLRELTDRLARERGIEVTPAELVEYRASKDASLATERERLRTQRDAVATELQSMPEGAANRRRVQADLAAAEHAIAALVPDPNAESAEVQAAEAEIASAFIRQWKINQALYRQYGGRIGFQQGGPEPIDATRKFLEEAAARGDFTIVDPVLEAPFWAYYRDDARHSFMVAGSAEEQRAFTRPPWEDG